MNAYEPLAQWLRAQTAFRISTAFPGVQNIVGFRLPISVRTFAKMWANDPKHSQGKDWIAAGYYTQEVNLLAETLVFVAALAGKNKLQFLPIYADPN